MSLYSPCSEKAMNPPSTRRLHTSRNHSVARPVLPVRKEEGRGGMSELDSSSQFWRSAGFPYTVHGRRKTRPDESGFVRQALSSLRPDAPFPVSCAPFPQGIPERHGPEY